jgi:hypothetical protein
MIKKTAVLDSSIACADLKFSGDIFHESELLYDLEVPDSIHD